MWIKLWANHGGGHQSYSEDYLWFDEKPSEETLEDTWNEWVNSSYLHNAKGGTEVIDIPPDPVIEKLLEKYRAEEQEAHRMVVLLETCKHTAPLKEQPPKLKAGWGYPVLGRRWHYFNDDFFSLCGTWMYTGELLDSSRVLAGQCRTCAKQLEQLEQKEK